LCLDYSSDTWDASGSASRFIRNLHFFKEKTLMPTTAVAGQVDLKKGIADPFSQHPVRHNVDFVADQPYLIVFTNPAVFGAASANLKAGHNHLHVQVDAGQTDYRLYPPGTGPELVEEEVTITEESVTANSVTVATESFSTLSKAAFGPTGNILVP
jgi:hypothetical protein